ncbi:hypothetical protein [Methanocalculus sp.]|jgi:hypothetical protein|uniref:hypothetical protein n=1 Tax=Methanocalculus sp. TaxID=2004547 RepID=UPI002635C2B7|nr:hypothetical protein [Methanocalculus sp.]MDG6251358.1 hypothetical protein [Methanocalculus sp.]
MISAERGKMTADKLKKTPMETVADRITKHQRQKLEEDLDEIEANGTFISWEKVKVELKW